jgi:hypothetical protein
MNALCSANVEGNGRILAQNFFPTIVCGTSWPITDQSCGCAETSPFKSVVYWDGTPMLMKKETCSPIPYEAIKAPSRYHDRSYGPDAKQYGVIQF